MSLTQAITDLISPAVSEAGFFLEEVQIASPGSHRIITCVVDGQTPLNLDQVTVASRLISELLDTAEFNRVFKIICDHVTFDGSSLSKLPDHWDDYPQDFMMFTTAAMGVMSYPFLPESAGGSTSHPVRASSLPWAWP